MSSRRKSRPVRRLLDCSLNVNHISSQSCNDGEEDNAADEGLAINSFDDEKEKRNSFEDPPEGVYVVQPRSASDDEEENTSFQENKTVYLEAQKQSTRKGSSYGWSHAESLKSLDLSVKRRKTETTLHGSALDNGTENKHHRNLKNYLDLMQKQSLLLGAALADDKNNRELNGSSRNKQRKEPYRPALSEMMASLAADDYNGNDFHKNEGRNGRKQTHQSKEVSNDGTDSQFSDSAVDSITVGTVSSGVGKSIKKGTLDPTNFDEDVFDQYITRYSLTNPCDQKLCPYTTKEHYHCTDSDCDFQRFTNKADVIRHYNMHKKRDNSLAHGFMRFCPSDDCTPQFGPCHLNGYSTHYHCLHKNCTKTYTSTSDVMAHDNFHKRYVNLVTNGFRRYRATDLCNDERCVFRDQRTTHFHCTRKDCNYTFKNRFETEKHRAYHVRDDAYTRQGFKKFYKSEVCSFQSCPWNKTANHFHCLRKNCKFSFTSTSQMVSHKRKHDRQEAALSFTDVAKSSLKVKLNSLQAAMSDSSPAPATSNEQSRLETPLNLNRPPPPSYEETSEIKSNRSSPFNDSLQMNSDRISFTLKTELDQDEDVKWSIVENSNGGSIPPTLTSTSVSNSTTVGTNKFFQRFQSGNCVFSNCVFFDHRHFHCTVQDCCAAFVDNQSVTDHTVFHEKLEKLGVSFPVSKHFSTPTTPLLNQQSENVISMSSLPPGFIALSSKAKPSMFSKSTNDKHQNLTPNHVTSSASDPKKTGLTGNTPIYFQQKIDPSVLSSKTKNIVKRDYFTYKTAVTTRSEPTLSSASNGPNKSMSIHQLLPLNAFQSSLKNATLSNIQNEHVSNEQLSNNGSSPDYIHVKAGTACYQTDCKYMMQSHWHCTLSRCRYVCKSLAKAQSHLQAHDTLEAYARAAKHCFRSYSMKKNCPNPNCEYRNRGHYHCLKPGCQFVTIGTSKLPWHMKKHEKIAKREASGFKYYMKKDKCGLSGCKYSHVYSHYHCVRPGCTFAFQYKHQMSTHVRKHLRKMLGRSYCSLDAASDILEAQKRSMNENSLALLADNQNNSPDDNQDELLEMQISADLTSNQSSHLQPVSRNFTPVSDDNNLSSYSEMETGTPSQDSAIDYTMDEEGSSDNEAINFSLNPELCGSDSDELNETDRPDSCPTTSAEINSSSDQISSTHLVCEPVNENNAMVLEMPKNLSSDSRVNDDNASECVAIESSNVVRQKAFHRVWADDVCSVEGCKLTATNHIHCLRCDFFCKEVSKMETHRRHHLNADILEESGFQRTQDCGYDQCKYKLKRTSHYHCLHSDCSFSVVGFGAMKPHANKHKQELKSKSQSKPQVNFSLITQSLPPASIHSTSPASSSSINSITMSMLTSQNSEQSRAASDGSLVVPLSET